MEPNELHRSVNTFIMGAMLRSDLMTLCDIYIQSEAAFEVLTCLGEMSCVQFLEMNSELTQFQKSYVTEVTRCAEMERKLRYMESAMEKDNIHISEIKTDPQPMQPAKMLMYENMLEKWENNIIELSTQQANILKYYLQLSEMHYVLEHIGPLFGDCEFQRDVPFFRKTDQAAAGDKGFGGKLYVITGVVTRVRSFSFQMMLWRVSRGNIYYRQAAQDSIFKDPRTGQEVRKVAFLAICQGEELNQHMLKVCSGFRVNVYPFPNTSDERMAMTQDIRMRIMDIEDIMAKTHYHICKDLRAVGRQWRTWNIEITKAKAIYHTMNLFNLDITRKCLIGQCWVPTQDLAKVQEKLECCSQRIGTNVSSFMCKTETNAIPPTYNRTNKFTKGFQALINAYGEPAYRELNPGLYSLTTFPFLFSLMFGDVGHGLILVLFATWMVRKEKEFASAKTNNEIWNIVFNGRYVILMLGSFSLFTGFIYNDIFSIPLLMMPPYWINNHSGNDLAEKKSLSLSPSNRTGPVYIFGMDPIMKLAVNKIPVENSLKMKMSIIIGVFHMLFGLILSLFNHIYFKKTYAIFLQFIPQVLFLLCLFMWLVFMVYFKWFIYSAKEKGIHSPQCAPSILILFVDMILDAESYPPLHTENCPAYMFESQNTVQQILGIVALACIPVLLFGTPLYELNKNRKLKAEAMKNISNFRRYRHRDSDSNREKELQAEVDKYSTSIGEMMILQGIHTIEYVLSTISHTASYLRLWALSLAHSQLTDMLWVMILRKLALSDRSTTGALKLVIIFAIWAAFSVSILVVMEGMSAFLHTLRLHWVEFMSKFFIGEGWMFQPFSFGSILYGDEEKPENSSKKTDIEIV